MNGPSPTIATPVRSFIGSKGKRARKATLVVYVPPRKIRVCPSGADLAVAHQTTPYMSVYPWVSGTGFGTKYANPATIPTSGAADVDFSPAGTEFAVAEINSPRVIAYAFTSGTGFGSKYANPATLPGTKAANRPTNTNRIQLDLYGVWYLGCKSPNALGNKPSLLIE